DEVYDRDTEKKGIAEVNVGEYVFLPYTKFSF
ncbi:unnamed protein product, partial [marine sediment metagenome]